MFARSFWWCAEGMCVALALMMSVCDCSDAEQPELITRQAVLEPRTVFVSLLNWSIVMY